MGIMIHTLAAASGLSLLTQFIHAGRSSASLQMRVSA
jgi:hypothetical protein